MLIDTHSHIYSEEFTEDLDEVVQRAFENGVRKILLPNIDSSSVKKMLDLTDQYPQICYPLMGLHPTSVTEDYEEELELIEFWLKKRKFYGIGEIGIDLYWDKTFIHEQTEAFRKQLQLAKKYRLPVVVHVRDSFQEVFEVLESEAGEGLSGVFHSFTGTAEQARQVVGLGFKLGINGIVTFKNSGLDQVVANVDPSHILLETDAPYLTPVPFRGKRNESSYLIYVARKIAEIHQLPVAELARITTENAEKLFGI
ncbi:TatD family hydrolase [Gaoshiqia sediminis]|uniref:TatD family hydrolase n=1 Tax=Gaoshiqia sediminis TaxID=2986998 RepID=A0AA41Y6Q8_9BACT|nr:TatD family hydrolase [Gaoshiqia sediminis]MCW0482486.1 TatD family hydrolase [Gaoshiqia sediminis]